MREELISRVMAHAGLSAADARVAIVAVLQALRGELARLEAEALADHLPDDLAAPLRQPAEPAAASLAARMAVAQQISSIAARERAASVCGALAELLPAPLVERLQRALSPETAALFVPPAAETHEPHLDRQRTTLAEGRPGSRHPLSEARPRAAQADSVASANPHGDTKLSSSRGLTQERERETLATGRPGPNPSWKPRP